MVSYKLPDSRPLQPNTAHIIVGNLNNLGQTKHPRSAVIGQFFNRHLTQCLHKLNCNKNHI